MRSVLFLGLGAVLTVVYGIRHLLSSPTVIVESDE